MRNWACTHLLPFLLLAPFMALSPLASWTVLLSHLRPSLVLSLTILGLLRVLGPVFSLFTHYLIAFFIFNYFFLFILFYFYFSFHSLSVPHLHVYAHS